MEITACAPASQSELQIAVLTGSSFTGSGNMMWSVD